MLHDSWTDCHEMVVIPSGQNIHPSAGADAVLTQAPTIDCHWRLLSRAQQWIQGDRVGSQKIGRLPQCDVGVNTRPVILWPLGGIKDQTGEQIGEQIL